MTEERMALVELLEKADDGDFLRALAEAVLQLLMEADVEGVIGAGRHQRSPARLNYRNGHRARTLDTRLGPLQLRIPKLRQGSDFPPFLEPRKTSEKALVAVIQEAWIGGVSTRRVDDLVQAMGLTGISKSRVSKLCKDIDKRVMAFLERPSGGRVALSGARCELSPTARRRPDRDRRGDHRRGGEQRRAARDHRPARRPVANAGLWGPRTPRGAETFWSSFLKQFVKPGLKGVRLVVSDAHEGLKHAIGRVPGCTWQRCRVHVMRNALAHLRKASTRVVAAALRQAFLQPDAAAAHQTWRQVADQLRARWPKLAALMDDSEHDVLASMTFPAQHRTKLHSTNPLERLNKEVKRRADVVGIFPNAASIVRLIGAVLLEHNDAWQLMHRSMQVEAMAERVMPAAEPDRRQLPPQAA